MPLLPEFAAPRLVAVYDALNPYAPGTQPDFYLRTARETGARTVVDVGCGTGLIAQRLVAQGHDVTGLDPSPLMLDLARARPGAGRARWIEGDLDALDVTGADLAFMAGHVAQFFTSDEAWRDALRVLRGALRPGGHLAFESRNPTAPWSGDPHEELLDTPQGPVRRRTRVVDVGGGVREFRGSYRFADGEELVAAADLRFRSADALRESLDEAGFAVVRTYGDWDRRPLDTGSPEIIVVAAAR